MSHRMPGTDLVEIDSLIEALNQMAGQLEDRLNTIVRQKNELAAVSPLIASLGKEARFRCICRRSNSSSVSLDPTHF